MLKLSSSLLILTIVANCAKVGDFCNVYDPVYPGADAAQAWAKSAPNAAKTAAANNAWFERECE
jgi:hypothetical protein